MRLFHRNIDAECVFANVIDVPVEELTLVEFQAAPTRPLCPLVTEVVTEAMPVEE
jgi:hypothetical protein